jgi:hypothetical protein
MKDFLKYQLIRLKYFFRIRKSRGFGIHSPFVFHLVTHVIKSKCLFYVFDLLEDEFKKFDLRDVKYAKIMYRIVTELNIRSVFCISPEFKCDNLIFEEDVCKYDFHTNLEDIKHDTDDYKIIYADESVVEELMDKAYIKALKTGKTIIVVREMYRNDKILNAYRVLKEESNMSIDMFYRGLLFFDEKLQSGAYSIKV